MRRWVLVLVAALVGATALAPAAVAGGALITVQGTVQNADGSPLAGVALTFEADDRSGPQTVLTDDHGRYVATGVPRDYLELVHSDPVPGGRTGLTTGGAFGFNGDQVETDDLVLPAAGSHLVDVVRDDSGQPVAGALVTCTVGEEEGYVDDGEHRAATLVYEGLSDAAGVVDLPVMTSAFCEMTTTADGGGAHRFADARLRASSTVLQWTLDSLTTVHGSVVSAGGTALVGTPVGATHYSTRSEPADTYGNSGTTSTGVVEADGTFSFAAAAEGGTTFTLASGSPLDVAVGLPPTFSLSAPLPPSPVDLVLPSPGHLHATVRNADGTPAPLSLVHAGGDVSFDAGGTSFTGSQTSVSPLTDSGGRGDVPLLPGYVGAAATRTSLPTQTAPEEQSDGQSFYAFPDASGTFTFPTPTLLCGVARASDGTPVAGLLVDADTVLADSQAVTGADGRYCVKVDPQQALPLRAPGGPAGLVASTGQLPAVPRSTTHDLTFPPLRHVTVRTDLGSTPTAAATVTATGAVRDLDVGGGWSLFGTEGLGCTRTGGDGSLDVPVFDTDALTVTAGAVLRGATYTASTTSPVTADTTALEQLVPGTAATSCPAVVDLRLPQQVGRAPAGAGVGARQLPRRAPGPRSPATVPATVR